MTIVNVNKNYVPKPGDKLIFNNLLENDLTLESINRFNIYLMIKSFFDNENQNIGAVCLSRSSTDSLSYYPKDNVQRWMKTYKIYRIND